MNSRPCIVVADDEELVRNALAGVVQKHLGPGYEVIAVPDGVDAVGLLQSEGARIVLFLLDLRMARMGGIEVVHYLVNHSIAPVAAIVITGYGADSDLSEFFGSETASFLPINFLHKPPNMDMLRNEVTRSLRHVAERREMNAAGVQMEVLQSVQRIESKLTTLKPKSFFEQVGYDLAKALFLAIAFVALLKAGLGAFISKLLNP